MPLSRFLSLLELKTIWFSRLGALQDKYECTNPKGPRGMLLSVLKNNPDLKEAKTPFGISYNDLLARTDNGWSGDGWRKGGLVNCWFIGKLESEKMWKNYGDDGKGVAIRSSIKQLASSFELPGGFGKISRVGRVNYVDFGTCDLGARGEDMVRVAFIKDKELFKDENEVRIVTLNSFHSGTLFPDGNSPSTFGVAPEIKGMHIKCSLQELIQGVVVGPNTDWNFHMLIKQIIGRYGLTVNVERSQIPPWSSIV